MCVRCTQTGFSKHGPRFSHRLCESVRSGSKVRQVTLLNVGADFPLPERRWRAFATLVQCLDAGTTPVFDPDPEMLKLAQRTASRLQRRRHSCSGNRAVVAEPVATVLLHSLHHPPTRSVGGERVALAALHSLRFSDILRGRGFSQDEASLATALVFARMLHPSSEREASRWLNQASSACELLGCDTQTLPAQNSL